jgi:hypothetical protein
MKKDFFFFKKAAWVSKYSEIDVDFESLEKLQKTHAKKSYQRKSDGKK